MLVELGPRPTGQLGPCLGDDRSSSLGPGGVERPHQVEDEAERVRPRSLGQGASLTADTGPVGDPRQARSLL